jgi:hypothetical protein
MTQLISGHTKLIAHLGVPTESFRAPMIYNPYFEAMGIALDVTSPADGGTRVTLTVPLAAGDAAALGGHRPADTASDGGEVASSL